MGKSRSMPQDRPSEPGMKSAGAKLFGKLGEPADLLAESERLAAFGWWAAYGDRLVASPGLLSLLATSAEQLRTVGDLLACIHPDDRERARLALDRARMQAVAWDMEQRLLRQDGSGNQVTVRSRGESRVEGGERRLLGSLCDISRRTALIKERDELTLKVEALGRTLAEAEKRKDDYLATLSHELRNPLAAIAAAAYLLEQFAENETTARARNVILRQTSLLTRMLEDLLDVSRLTRGRVELRRDLVEMADVIRRALDAQQSAIDGRGHHLSVDLPGMPLRVWGDSARLEQVIGKLVDNAIKYTPPGGSIAVTGDRQGGDIVVSVRDSGVGIAADVLRKALQPIHELQPQAGKGGLGLGLPLVRSLVEMHGGRLEGRNLTAPRGSEFIIRLPAAEPRGAAAGESRQQASTTAARRRLRVLVVEDNVDSAEVFAESIALWGHAVRVAYDGKSGLAAALAETPDVVLIDIGLPDMDGFQVARLLQEQLPWRPLLVALTGYGQPEDRRRAAEAGMQPHLVKPVDMNRLREILDTAVDYRW
jgi:signal transduction histidine kinase/ActR/RegA family two-component response regulator